MNSKHTQGKWIADNQLIIVKNDNPYIGDKNIAFCGYDNKEEAQANAKLIAAAPLLYNAAYNALQAIYAMPKGKQGFYQYLKNDLLNAIQKADGTIL